MAPWSKPKDFIIDEADRAPHKKIKGGDRDSVNEKRSKTKSPKDKLKKTPSKSYGESARETDINKKEI